MVVVIESPHEPGSGAAPAGAVRCERGDRRKAGALPGFVEPGHPTLCEEAPAGARWVADASERILFAEHLEGESAQIQERAGAMGVIVETPASPPNL
jgi:hypothetical protein